MMKSGIKSINICDIFLVLCCLYMFHWFEAGIFILDRISNILLLLILSISAFSAIYAHINYTLPKLFKVIDLLIIIFSFYGILNIASGEVHIIKFSDIPIDNATYLVSVLRSFLPFYTFYVFAKKGYLAKRELSLWAIIFLLVSIAIYYRSLTVFRAQWGTSEVTNNTGYLFVMLIPFFFCLRGRTLIRYSYLIICLLVIILCYKRGAIFIGLLAAIYCILRDTKSASRKQRTLTLFFALILCVTVIVFIGNLYNTNDLFRHRMEMTAEGNTSGRNAIINRCKEYYLNEASFFQMMFGSGADATLKIGSNYAHNDWWELLINQGIIGLFIYILFWYSLFSNWLKKKHDIFIFNMMGACVLVLFAKTFFSMNYSAIQFPVSLCLGFSLAKENNNSPQK